MTIEPRQPHYRINASAVALIEMRGEKVPGPFYYMRPTRAKITYNRMWDQPCRACLRVVRQGELHIQSGHKHLCCFCIEIAAHEARTPEAP